MLYTVQCIYFFFNDTATTEIYTLSLHDALPISRGRPHRRRTPPGTRRRAADLDRVRHRRGRRRHRRRRRGGPVHPRRDRKSTRLNSSHANISYAVFCLKKKKKMITSHHTIISHE